MQAEPRATGIVITLAFLTAVSAAQTVVEEIPNSVVPRPVGFVRDFSGPQTWALFGLDATGETLLHRSGQALQTLPGISFREAFEDFDGDGRRDYLAQLDDPVTGQLLPAVHLLSAATHGILASFPPDTHALVDDVDGDGVRDLRSGFDVFSGRLGTFLFTLPLNVAWPFGAPLPVESAGDFDGDGTIDWLAGTTIWSGASFSPLLDLSTRWPAGSALRAFPVGDVDGDGRSEVAGVPWDPMYGPMSLRIEGIATSEPGGAFTALAPGIIPTRRPHPLGLTHAPARLGDLNGDGCDDVHGEYFDGPGVISVHGVVEGGPQGKFRVAAMSQRAPGVYQPTNPHLDPFRQRGGYLVPLGNTDGLPGDEFGLLGGNLEGAWIIRYDWSPPTLTIHSSSGTLPRPLQLSIIPDGPLPTAMGPGLVTRIDAGPWAASQPWWLLVSLPTSPITISGQTLYADHQNGLLYGPQTGAANPVSFEIPDLPFVGLPVWFQGGGIDSTGAVVLGDGYEVIIGNSYF